MGEEGLLLLGLGLLAAAVLLVLAEVFLPSGGIIAIVAGGVAIAGIVNLFRYDNTWGFIGVLLVLVAGPMVFAFGLRVWPNTPIGKKMLLGEATEEELAAKRQAELDERDRRKALVGAEGEVVTTLRPVGVVQIGPERFDALSESGVIEAGERVRVTEVYDNQVKVRQA